MKCIYTKTVIKEGGYLITVPCGKCPACKMNKAEQWVARCVIEYMYSIESYFITITYDDKNINIQKNIEVLNKKDVQKFFKRLRKKISLRYFMAGEYGDKTFRPHYHILLFLNTKNNFEKLYSTIKNIWGKGTVIDISPTNMKSIKYVVRYFIDRDERIDKLFKKEQIQTPFVLMSRNPAIGFQLTNEPKKFIDVMEEGYIGLDKAYPIHPYYRNTFKEFYAKKYYEIAQKKGDKNIDDTIKKIGYVKTIQEYDNKLKQLLTFQRNQAKSKIDNLTFRKTLKI